MYLTVPEFINKMVVFYGNNPNRWIKGDFFLYDDGDPQAACLSGCIYLFDQSKLGIGTAGEVAKLIFEEIGSTNIPMWNDASERTFEDVMSLLYKIQEKAANV